jgi:hypothetical protein
MFKLIFLPLAILLSFGGAAFASNHFTDKQLEALASRVGKTFWITSVNGKTPVFLTAPAAGAATFRSEDNGSFEIVELTGQAKRDPYYKVRFESGKVGYIRPEIFHEEFNATILTIDPRADEKKKSVRHAEEEQKRVEWIKAQPWSPAVKEAALRKQPTPGLNGAEVKQIIGLPSRVTKTRGPIKFPEELWFYPDGSVLTFHSGLLSKIEKREAK